MIAVVVTGFCVTQPAIAQVCFGHDGYGHRGGYIGQVQHTTTKHIGIVRHGNHFDALAHATTHFDRVHN